MYVEYVFSYIETGFLSTRTRLTNMWLVAFTGGMSEASDYMSVSVISFSCLSFIP